MILKTLAAAAHAHIPMLHNCIFQQPPCMFQQVSCFQRCHWQSEGLSADSYLGLSAHSYLGSRHGSRLHLEEAKPGQRGDQQLNISHQSECACLSASRCIFQQPNGQNANSHTVFYHFQVQYRYSRTIARLLSCNPFYHLF